MHAPRAVAWVGLALLCGPAKLSIGADPATAGAGSEQARIMVIAPSGLSTGLTAEDVAQLPATQVALSLASEHGTRQVSFEGPLLWTLFDHAHAIDPEKPREQVRQTIEVTGRDGYSVILALAEIAPAFEGKQVILAERMDGEPLGPEHFRIVVPGERRGGRSVRDVVRIAVAAPGSAPQHQ
jgi:DMSO/TMAO reductase YedYZ molybdopterin-dependent catalytic subunit